MDPDRISDTHGRKKYEQDLTFFVVDFFILCPCFSTRHFYELPASEELLYNALKLWIVDTQLYKADRVSINAKDSEL